MLKAAIEKILEISQPSVFTVEGKSFCTESLKEIRPQEYVQKEFNLCSLDALEKVLRTETQDLVGPIYITVPSCKEVHCYTIPLGEKKERLRLYTAFATDVPGFSDTRMSYENAMIALRSRFQPNKGTEYLLSLLSRITDENSVSTQDNGITQSVTVKQGISLATKETVRPIVKLKPYRTFQEVDQPESEFIIKVYDGGEIGFYEADGGMWKLTARNTIKTYLKNCLSDLEKKGLIVISL